MMLRKIVFIAYAIFIGSLALAQEANAIFYEISFPNLVHHEAEIAITFRELSNEPLYVQMSRSSPGRYALHEFAKNVYNVRAYNGEGKPLSVAKSNPHRWQISDHDGVIQVKYTLFADRADGTYSAIDYTHAHLNMPATFMWAEGLEQRKIQLKIHIPNKKWSIATQLEPDERRDLFNAPHLQYFMDSPIEISDLQWCQWRVSFPGGKEQQIRLAVHHHGDQREVEAYSQMAKAVIHEQLAIFGELPNFDYGVYTFIADYLPHVHSDGMEHRNSTILCSTATLSERAADLIGVVSHEFFHCWNVERIRPKSIEPFDFSRANMCSELWFAEGFTSYYDGLTVHRAGISSLDRFTSSLARRIEKVENSPGRRFFSPVEMSQRAPFVDAATSLDPQNDDNIFISYYTYGSAIALGLDLTLRTEFDDVTLDDFMRAVWHRYGKSETPYTNEDLRRVLGETTGNSEFADNFFRRYIYGREIVDYHKLLAHAGILVERRRDRAAIGEVSLRYREGVAKIASRPLIASPLYEAGLDLGDEILELDGKSLARPGDLDKILYSHKPGDVVKIIFRKRGRKFAGKLQLSESRELQVIPYEYVRLSVTEEIRQFRQNWLASRSQEKSTLYRHCHKCQRQYPFAFAYCPYDGGKLQIVEKKW